MNSITSVIGVAYTPGIKLSDGYILDWQNRHDDAVSNLQQFKATFNQRLLNSLSSSIIVSSSLLLLDDKVRTMYFESKITGLNQELSSQLDIYGLIDVNPEMYAMGMGGVARAGFGALVRGAMTKTTGTIGFRYMSQAELKAIQETGYLRGGLPGETYFTKDLYKSSAHAQLRLSLGNSPALRVEFEILNNPTFLLNGTKVMPANGMIGRGAEFMTTDPIKVKLINWQPLK